MATHGRRRNTGRGGELDPKLRHVGVKGGQCICELCKCGRHRCAPVSDPAPKFDAVTSTQADYPPKDPRVARQPSYKPRSQSREPGKFYGETEAMRCYAAHTVSPPERRAPPRHVVVTGPFEGESESHGRFVKKSPTEARQAPYRPKGEYNPGGGKFDGTTSNLADFAAKDTAAARQPAYKPRSQSVTKHRFEATTTTADSFPGYKPDPPKRRTPRKYEPNPAKMDAVPESRAAFKGERGELQQPYVRVGEYQPGGGKFESVTSSQSDYTPKDIAAAQQPSYKPRPQSRERGKFYSSTEAGRAFVPHKEPPPERRAPPRHVVVTGPFEGESESHGRFVKKSPMEARQAPFRPKGEYNPGGGKFDGTTSNLADFAAKDTAAARQPAYKPRSQSVTKHRFEATTTTADSFPGYKPDPPKRRTPRKYEPNPAKMDAVPESRAAFKGERGELQKPFVRVGEYQPGGGKFEAETETKKSYGGSQTMPMKMYKPRAVDSLEVKSKFTDERTSTQYGAGDAVPRPRESLRPKRQTLDTGKFEGTTTSKAMGQFGAKELSEARQAPYRPKGQESLFQGPFVGTTTAQEMAKTASMRPERRENLKPKPKPREVLKFEGTTTAQEMAAATKGKPERRKPFKRESAYRPPSGGFVGDTTSKDSFKPKTPDVCTGALMVDKSPGKHELEMMVDGRHRVGVKPRAVSRHGHVYAFGGRDEGGHEFYGVVTPRSEDFAKPAATGAAVVATGRRGRRSGRGEDPQRDMERGGRPF